MRLPRGVSNVYETGFEDAVGSQIYGAWSSKTTGNNVQNINLAIYPI